ncbi:hypothetical protein F5148DRAFT_1146871 [Russula earlei]|uniref:Uncharacterized protein n=1 Tax=Russula earlei TaxID=71964 RepID=A0ACC0UKF8_9AGAM|nr:hypothetical protein F5148DRAFT_1146871 [Russula earlei]
MTKVRVATAPPPHFKSPTGMPALPALYRLEWVFDPTGAVTWAGGINTLNNVLHVASVEPLEPLWEAFGGQVHMLEMELTTAGDIPMVDVGRIARACPALEVAPPANCHISPPPMTPCDLWETGLVWFMYFKNYMQPQTGLCSMDSAVYGEIPATSPHPTSVAQVCHCVISVVHCCCVIATVIISTIISLHKQWLAGGVVVLWLEVCDGGGSAIACHGGGGCWLLQQAQHIMLKHIPLHLELGLGHCHIVADLHVLVLVLVHPMFLLVLCPP